MSYLNEEIERVKQFEKELFFSKFRTKSYTKQDLNFIKQRIRNLNKLKKI